MIIETIPNSEINRLYTSIYANMSSFRKRSISFIISPHSNSVASVILYVTGKRGTVTNNDGYVTVNLKISVIIGRERMRR